VRFENTALLAQAQGGTSAEFAMAFTIDANRSLTIMLHEVYLALAKTPIEGPAGVEASFDFRAGFNATATRMMTTVLRNQQAGTKYASEIAGRLTKFMWPARAIEKAGRPAGARHLPTASVRLPS